MSEIKEKVNKLWDFIETHATEKDEYPKDLYDSLEDFINLEEELIQTINEYGNLTIKYLELQNKLYNSEANNEILRDITIPRFIRVIKVLKDVLNISVIEDKQKHDFVYYWLALDKIAEKELSKDDYELLSGVFEYVKD